MRDRWKEILVCHNSSVSSVVLTRVARWHFSQIPEIEWFGMRIIAVWHVCHSLACFWSLLVVLAEKTLLSIFLEPVCFEFKLLDSFQLLGIYWSYFVTCDLTIQWILSFWSWNAHSFSVFSVTAFCNTELPHDVTSWDRRKASFSTNRNKSFLKWRSIQCQSLGRVKCTLIRIAA